MRRTTNPAILGLCLALTLAGSGCGSKSDDAKPATTTTTTASTAPPTTGTTLPPVSSDRAKLRFAPVLASGPCPGSAATTPTTTTTAPPTTTTTSTPGFNNLVGNTIPTTTSTSGPGTTVPGTTTSDGRIPTADGRFCYQVGPGSGDGNDLEDATIGQAGGAWQVLARVRAESVAKLNSLFDSCFQGVPTCPAGEGGHGYVAIIWGDTVLYAPAVQVEGLADGPFSLAGGLTERRARDLAALINH